MPSSTPHREYIALAPSLISMLFTIASWSGVIYSKSFVRRSFGKRQVNAENLSHDVVQGLDRWLALTF